MRGVSAEIAAPVTAAGGPGCAVVAAGSEVTAAAAVTALEAGGNAIDAAIAAGFAAAVGEPTLSSLGGGGFLLVSDSSQAPPRILDFFVDVPGLGGVDVAPNVETLAVTYGSSAQQVFHVGWGTVATPGCFAGYLDAHRRWGRLPLDVVVAPAIMAARNGVVLDPVQREFIDVIGAILRVTPESESLYAAPLRGQPFRNQAYADLLDALARGTITGPADPAYARPLADAMSAHGGLITLRDLQAYAPVMRRPISARRGDARIWTNPPPSFGGGIVLEALGLTPRHLDPAALWSSLAQALRDATQRRRQHGEDTPQATKGTTHVSVIDGQGRVAALSMSNGSGSGVTVNGVSLNNMLGEEDLQPEGAVLESGSRMGSMMAPTMITRADGSVIVMGTGGSERIRSALSGVIARYLDLGSSLPEAIGAARMHPGSNLIDVEPGFTGSEMELMRSDRGPVREWEASDLYFGGVHAAMRAPDGSVMAIGDVRRGGAVAVVAGG